MKIDNEVLAVLSRAGVNGNAVTLIGQLDRKLYERTNKVLEAAGGKWNRSSKAHLFDGDASTRIEQIILTGDIVIPKDEFEFFPTPHQIGERVIDLADIQDDMVVLEPSAGHGNLAIKASLAANNVIVEMYEMMPANHEQLSKLATQLEAKFKLSPAIDFLNVVPAPIYDRVVMNPPFSRQADIKHVLHALKFLKPGGRLVSVMAAGVCFRENKLTTDFRELVAARGGSFEALPDGAFKSSGTMVGTVIVTIPM